MYGLLLDLSARYHEALPGKSGSIRKGLRVERRVRGSPLVIIQSTFPRKTSKLIYIKTVPQTDTGGQLE